MATCRSIILSSSDSMPRRGGGVTGSAVIGCTPRRKRKALAALSWGTVGTARCRCADQPGGLV